MLTLRGSRIMLASGVWLTIYLFCVVMVASFIFFEVLDVDGSDFPTHPSQMAARPAEAQHDDIKRLWLLQPVKIWTDLWGLEMERPDRSDREVPAQTSPPQPTRQHRVALPRAALADVPPSA